MVDKKTLKQMMKENKLNLGFIHNGLWKPKTKKNMIEELNISKGGSNKSDYIRHILYKDIFDINNMRDKNKISENIKTNPKIIMNQNKKIKSTKEDIKIFRKIKPIILNDALVDIMKSKGIKHSKINPNKINHQQLLIKIQRKGLTVVDILNHLNNQK